MATDGRKDNNNKENIGGRVSSVLASLFFALVIIVALFFVIRLVMYHGVLFFSGSVSKALIFMNSNYYLPFFICMVCYPFTVFAIYKHRIKK